MLWLSTALSYDAKRVVGVDIDKDLISAAQKLRRQIWSQCKVNLSSEDVERSEGQRSVIPNYFPASLSHMFGPLPVPTMDENSKETFPHNVVFRTADWTKEEIVDDADGYDVIIA